MKYFSCIKKNLIATLALSFVLSASSAVNIKKYMVDFDESMGTKTYNKATLKYKASFSLEKTIEFFDFLRILYNKNSFAKLKPQEKAFIPKVIHQIWVGGPFPEKYLKWQKTVRNLHPGWEYKLWTDADIDQLNLINRDLYNQTNDMREKANIARYEILYQFGGVYLDTDIEGIQPLDILNHTYKFYAAISPLDCISVMNNAVIGSIPGHPILKYCIDTVKEHWHLSTVAQRSGARHFEKSFWHIAKQNNDRVIALPKTFFHPLNKFETMNANVIKPETFTIHYWKMGAAKILAARLLMELNNEE